MADEDNYVQLLGSAGDVVEAKIDRSKKCVNLAGLIEIGNEFFDKLDKNGIPMADSIAVGVIEGKEGFANFKRCIDADRLAPDDFTNNLDSLIEYEEFTSSIPIVFAFISQIVKQLGGTTVWIVDSPRDQSSKVWTK